MPYEEALEEFFAQIESHIHPEFAAQTDIVQLLRTKGAKVFVPNNWEYDTFLAAFPGGSLVKHVVKNGD